MKNVCVIVARTGSSRLPGKVLLPILGKPMLERMIERIRRSKSAGDILIATTTLPEDEALVAFAAKVGAGCFRGSPEDVLGRLQAAVAYAKADVVVELLGDNPLVHSDLIDDVLEFYHAGKFDYAANVTTEYPHAGPAIAKFPVGIRVQAYSRQVLDRCAEEATSAYNREHSTTFIGEHPELFTLGYFEAKGPWAALKRPDLTFAVNYRQNFDLVERIFEKCHPKDPNFNLQAALAAFDAEPALRELMGEPRRQVA